MKQFALTLTLVILTIGQAQSKQAVEYGVLQLGPTNYTWSTDNGGSYVYDPIQLLSSMTNGTVDIRSQGEHEQDLFERAPVSYFLNHLAEWGWRLVDTMPQPEGGAKYIFERSCNFEPSGCYQH